jgi:hypothetical protein
MHSHFASHPPAPKLASPNTMTAIYFLFVALRCYYIPNCKLKHHNNFSERTMKFSTFAVSTTLAITSPHARLNSHHILGRFPVAAAFASTSGPFVSGSRVASKRHDNPSQRSFLVATRASPSALEMSKLRGGGTNEVTSWTFDKPCDTMDWTPFAGERVTLKRLTDETALDASLGGSDFIFIGVQGPVKEERDDDEEDDEIDVEPIELNGQAKVLDARYGGVLTDVLRENGKSFKNGSALGSTTPVLRIVSGGKVRNLHVATCNDYRFLVFLIIYLSYC